MQPREHYTESRRWAKFPATVLLATGLLWLLQNYFDLDLTQLGELTETGLGIVVAMVDLLLIPLGSVAVGIFLLFCQRWAVIAAGPLSLAALIITTADKVQRIIEKFGQYRTTNETAAYGDAVMTILLIIALWALFGLVLFYLSKTWRHMNAAQEWLAQPRPKPGTQQSDEQRVEQSGSSHNIGGDEVCLLLPDAGDSDADEPFTP